MSFEDAVSRLHESVFLREFTFSTSTFVPPGSTEVELADSVVAIGTEMAIVQVKERSLPAGSATPAGEKKWFRKKVLGEATRQLRETMAFFKEMEIISVSNGRGLSVDLRLEAQTRVHKVALYRATDVLPMDCRATKHHLSGSIGFIHLFDSIDYVEVITRLVTPREFFDYLDFRETNIQKWGDLPHISERSLLGQYLSSQLSDTPDPGFSLFVDALVDNTDLWDVSDILKKYGDRITTPDQAPDSYYPILREIAQLTRTEVQPFKERFMMAIMNAKAGKLIRPYRIAIPRTSCGFVFGVLPAEGVASAEGGLHSLTQAHKYEQRLSKCVGIAVRWNGNEFDILWSYIESTWKFDSEMERFVNESGLLRSLQSVTVPRYEFQL